MGQSGVGVEREIEESVRRILGALDRERHAGEIAGALSLRISELLPVLIEMELANLVVKRSGDYYKRKS